MSQHLPIGLLSHFFQPISGYEQAANRLNLSLAIITPGSIDWNSQKVQALVWNGMSWDPQTIPLPKAIYNRFYGPKPQVVDRLEAILGPNKVFNHITRFNKWVIHNILTDSDLKPYLPATTLYTPESLLSYLNHYGQVILKPLQGKLGSRVYLLTKKARSYFIHHGSNYPIATIKTGKELLAKLDPILVRPFLIQQFVPLARLDGRVFDLRFLVQKESQGLWKVSGRLSRQALRYSYITNLSQAITPVEGVLETTFPGSNFLATLDTISIKGAQIAEQSLGSLGELSVDFGLDAEGKIWIIELNAKPMKFIFQALDDPMLLQEIYELPLHYARHLATT